MSPRSPLKPDLPVLRRCVAEYRKYRLRGMADADARQMAYAVLWTFRPRAATDEVHYKADNPIDWAWQELPDWMAGR